MGIRSWELDHDALITFFRQHDQTSAITGKRQAVTFEALSSLCGHQQMPSVKGKQKTSPRPQNNNKNTKKTIKQKQVSAPAINLTANQQNHRDNNSSENRPVGLTVRIEVNLPADGDQETYDRIFKSIRENLLNG
jgi:hypothetical protein